MSDPTETDTEQVADDIISNLSIPEGGTVQRDLTVHTDHPRKNTAHVSVEAGIPIELAREIIEEAEERVDLRRRGKVGEAIVDLDNYTWELEIEGEKV
jgi:divalent metal cation (Fe/Co/Zn/Cd) transporter